MTSQEIVYEVHFFSENSTPYILKQEAIEYMCNGNEGYVHFDGYYYVEDTAPPYPEDLDPDAPYVRRREHYLPQTLYMQMKKREKEPSKEEYDEVEKCTRISYNVMEEYMYKIEIYKRVIHECTNKYSEIEDDGEPMTVCFFPTNRQTVYFRILETLQ